MVTIDFESDLGKRALDRLENEQVAWLTTVSANGTPLPTPVWFHWQDGVILIYSEPDTAKVRAIRDHPRVALNFNSDEHGGNVVILKGSAELITKSPPLTTIPDYVEKYRQGVESLGLSPEAMAAQYSQQIRITPDRLSGF